MPSAGVLSTNWRMLTTDFFTCGGKRKGACRSPSRLPLLPCFLFLGRVVVFLPLFHHLDEPLDDVRIVVGEERALLFVQRTPRAVVIRKRLVQKHECPVGMPCGIAPYGHSQKHLAPAARYGHFSYARSCKQGVHRKNARTPHGAGRFCSLVPVVGLEPTRILLHRILSPARLPVSPHRRID